MRRCRIARASFVSLYSPIPHCSARATAGSSWARVGAFSLRSTRSASRAATCSRMLSSSSRAFFTSAVSISRLSDTLSAASSAEMSRASIAFLRSTVASASWRRRSLSATISCFSGHHMPLSGSCSSRSIALLSAAISRCLMAALAVLRVWHTRSQILRRLKRRTARPIFPDASLRRLWSATCEVWAEQRLCRGHMSAGRKVKNTREDASEIARSGEGGRCHQPAPRARWPARA